VENGRFLLSVGLADAAARIDNLYQPIKQVVSRKNLERSGVKWLSFWVCCQEKSSLVDSGRDW
jgi:hypothetical protein